MGAPSGAPFPLSGKSNSAQSATFDYHQWWRLFSKLLSKELIMPAPSSNADLKNAVESIDSFSRYGFSRIGSIARLAIIAMESSGQSVRTPDDVKHALSAIWALADETDTLIASEVEDVGCTLEQKFVPYYWDPVDYRDTLSR